MSSGEKTGMGTHAMWGHVPALNLLERAPVQGEINILVCRPGDIGHVLRTLGSRRCHPQHTINVYVYENRMEVIARHILLLRIAHDWELPLRHRANTFLEVFGNCFVQERTSRYIARLGEELIQSMFSASNATDVIDLSLLKSRQRDMLEAAFKSWACETPCDMKALRDSRLRSYFGARYDHRKNLVDWDYTNKLKEVASIIHHTQYRKWRLEGVAYEFGDQVYDQPNRTMMSFAEGIMLRGQHRGLRKEMRGFWLDIRGGPFITFGVECETPNAHAQELFSIINKGTGTEQHRHNTAEIAAFSVISYMWGLESRERYMMKKKNDVYSGLGDHLHIHEPRQDAREDHVSAGSGDLKADTSGADSNDAASDDRSPSTEPTQELTKTPAHQNKRSDGLRREEAIQKAQCIAESLDGVKVFMLSEDLGQSCTKTRLRRLFERVHLSLPAVDLAGAEGINEILADEAIITLDTGRYVIPFSKEQQRTFSANASELACKQGWTRIFGADQSGAEPLSTDDAFEHASHVSFSFKRKPAYA